MNNIFIWRKDRLAKRRPVSIQAPHGGWDWALSAPSQQPAPSSLGEPHGRPSPKHLDQSCMGTCGHLKIFYDKKCYFCFFDLSSEFDLGVGCFIRTGPKIAQSYSETGMEVAFFNYTAEPQTPIAQL